MLARLSLLTLAMTAIAGVAYAAQPTNPPISPSKAPTTQQAMTHHEVSQAMAPAHGQRHKVAITDEYGFHYDSAGNRLNSAGYVVAPPHTPRGAAVIQNGRGGA